VRIVYTVNLLAIVLKYINNWITFSLAVLNVYEIMRMVKIVISSTTVAIDIMEFFYCQSDTHTKYAICPSIHFWIFILVFFMSL